MVEVVQRVRRGARVARTGLGIYIGYKRLQRSAAGLPEAERTARWAKKHAEAGESLYRLAVDLKGMYVKTGQFISARPDIIPLGYTRALVRLQDSMPAHPARVVRRVIERELGRPVSELFASFEDEPIGAASLAQVHRATLPDGREVAVKVQYPEVAGLVRGDARALTFAVRLLARWEPNFDYRTVAAEIAEQVPKELDFVREGALTERVRQNLRNVPGVVVPEVIPGYSAERVMVTEYLHGGRLLDSSRHGELGADPVKLAATLTNAFGHQMLIDGLFQADPHPGNVLVLPGGGIGLLDYGLTKELPDATRLAFARLVVALSTLDMAGMMAALRELGVKTKSDDPAEVLPLLDLFFNARPDSQTVQERQGLVNRNPVEAIPGDLVLLGRVVGLLRGVCASLGSPVTPLQMLQPYAERALAEGNQSAA